MGVSSAYLFFENKFEAEDHKRKYPAYLAEAQVDVE